MYMHVFVTMVNTSQTNLHIDWCNQGQWPYKKVWTSHREIPSWEWKKKVLYYTVHCLWKLKSPAPDRLICQWQRPVTSHLIRQSGPYSQTNDTKLLFVKNNFANNHHQFDGWELSLFYKQCILNIHQTSLFPQLIFFRIL